MHCGEHQSFPQVPRAGGAVLAERLFAFSQEGGTFSQVPDVLYRKHVSVSSQKPDTRQKIPFKRHHASHEHRLLSGISDRLSGSRGLTQPSGIFSVPWALLCSHTQHGKCHRVSRGVGACLSSCARHQSNTLLVVRSDREKERFAFLLIFLQFLQPCEWLQEVSGSRLPAWKPAAVTHRGGICQESLLHVT